MLLSAEAVGRVKSRGPVGAGHAEQARVAPFRKCDNDASKSFGASWIYASREVVRLSDESRDHTQCAPR